MNQLVARTPQERNEEVKREILEPLPNSYKEASEILARRFDELAEILGLPVGTPWPAVKHIIWWMVYESRQARVKPATPEVTYGAD